MLRTFLRSLVIFGVLQMNLIVICSLCDNVYWLQPNCSVRHTVVRRVRQVNLLTPYYVVRAILEGTGCETVFSISLRHERLFHNPAQ